MSEEEKAKGEGCVESAAGPLVEAEPAAAEQARAAAKAPVRAALGKEAPDFEAIAFHQGKFGTVRLSDYRGQWVVLCFYPADFTFV